MAFCALFNKNYNRLKVDSTSNESSGSARINIAKWDALILSSSLLETTIATAKHKQQWCRHQPIDKCWEYDGLRCHQRRRLLRCRCGWGWTRAHDWRRQEKERGRVAVLGAGCGQHQASGWSRCLCQARALRGESQGTLQIREGRQSTWAIRASDPGRVGFPSKGSVASSSLPPLRQKAVFLVLDAVCAADWASKQGVWRPIQDWHFPSASHQQVALLGAKSNRNTDPAHEWNPAERRTVVEARVDDRACYCTLQATTLDPWIWRQDSSEPFRRLS